MGIVSFVVKRTIFQSIFIENFNGALNSVPNITYWTDDYNLNPTIRNQVLLDGNGNAVMNFSNVGDKNSTLFSSFTIDGDFDIREKVSTLSIQALHLTGCLLSIDIDSTNRMYVGRVYQTTGGQVMKIFALINNVTDIDTYIPYTSTSDLRFRITRSGSTWTGYYWDGTSWISLGSSNIGTGKVIIRPLHYSSNTSTLDWSSYLDYIDVQQGTFQSRNIWLNPNSGSSIRQGHKAIEYNGKMYVFGGENGSTYFNDVWEFNLSTSVWTQKTSGATSRYLSSLVEYNGKMYVFGGFNGLIRYNDVWEYNLTTNVWTQKTSGATTRHGHTAVQYNGKMYVFGGYNGTTNLNDVWEYNLTTNVWTQKTSGATARRSHSASVYNGKMYVFGGNNGTTNLNDVWEYDLTTDVWTQKTSGATIREHCGNVVSTDKMYIFAGRNGSTYMNDIWEYNLTTDVWTQKIPTGWPSNATIRGLFSIVIYNNDIFAFGGHNGISYLNDVWKYLI